jgi:cytochrome c5
MTYEVGGRQYISLTLQGARLIALSLDAGPALAQPAAGAGLLAPAASDSALPPGGGRDVLQRACSTCHGVEIVTATRLDRAGWDDVVRDMVSRGASASPEEVDQVIRYLATNFAAIKD